MAYQIPAELSEFCSQWQKAINENENYRYYADGWGIEFNGDLLAKFVGNSQRNGKSFSILLELEDGDCLGIRRVDSSEVEYGFKIQGGYDEWAELLEPADDIWGHITTSMDFAGNEETFREFGEAQFEIVKEAMSLRPQFS